MAYLEEAVEGRPSLGSVDNNEHRSRNGSEVAVLLEDIDDTSSEDEYFELSSPELIGPDSSDDSGEVSENDSVYNTASSGTSGSLSSVRLSNVVRTPCSELADNLASPAESSDLRSPYHSVFPTEICERMIDHCGGFDHHDGRYRTLKACALTCRAWRYRSQSSLFFAVVLKNMKALKSFETVIQLHPSIRSHVYHLEIHFNATIRFWQGPANPIKYAIGTTLIIFHQKLPKLKSLLFSEGEVKSLHACTCMIARQYTTITHLTIRGWLDDNSARAWFSLINSIPNLSHLDITEPTFFALPKTLWRYQHYLRNTKLVFLAVVISIGHDPKNIRLIQSDALIPYILASPSAATLNKLWFGIKGSFPDAMYAQNLLSICGSSVYECTLDFMNQSGTFGLIMDPEESLLNFKFNTNLNKLHLIRICRNHTPMIYLLLSTISSAILETLTLDTIYGIFTNSDWSSIAALLSTNKFTHLQRLILCLDHGDVVNETLVRQSFPNQAASGILFVRQIYIYNDLKRDLGFDT